MKNFRFLLLIVILLVAACSCQKQEQATVKDPVMEVTHDGVTIEITGADFIEDDLMATFKISEEVPAEQPVYQLLMPWTVILENGEQIESSHSAFYNAFDDDQERIPGTSRLEVFFDNVAPSDRTMDIQASIKPKYLVPSEDGYCFEMDLDGIQPDGNPVTAWQLGFLVTASAEKPEADVLAITVRVEASSDLLKSLSYAIQPAASDQSGRTYISNQSLRQSDSAGYQEETLVFQGIDPQSETFSLRYPIQVRATLPDTVDFLFQYIPMEN